MARLDDPRLVIKAVFDKYSNDGMMDRLQFSLVISKLAQHVEDLQGYNPDIPGIIFILLDENRTGSIDLSEFTKWWNTRNKYSYFTGEKASKLRKAYSLYQQHSSIAIGPDQKGINVHGFIKLLKYFKIEGTEKNFGEIDTNADGAIDFIEFCKWLNWF